MRIFHLYKGFHRKSTTIGFFVKGSARVVEPPRIEYKGFKYKYSIKGDIARTLIVRTNLPVNNNSHNSITLQTNSGVCIKKRSETKSKYINGPITIGFRRRRLASLFKTVII